MHESEDIRNLIIALAAYILAFAMKLSGYFNTGVMTLLGDLFSLLSHLGRKNRIGIGLNLKSGAGYLQFILFMPDL